jgi:hypothetical protein
MVRSCSRYRPLCRAALTRGTLECYPGPVRQPPSFEQVSQLLVWQLAIAGFQVLAVAIWWRLPELLGWHPEPSMHRTVAIVWLLAPAVMLLRTLPNWSLRSHQLAVSHGQISRWSSTWATWGWLVPGVNLWLPFAMLRARRRFYRCAGRDPLVVPQVAFWLAALQAFVPSRGVAVLGAGFFLAVGLFWLRVVLRGIAVEQVRVEHTATAERVFG